MTRCFLSGAGLTVIGLAFTTIVGFTSSSQPKSSYTILSDDSLYNKHITSLYNEVHLGETGLNEEVFEKAMTGFYNLKKTGQLNVEKSILTIADFDKNSTEKRLWIIDLAKKKLILNTWVAHGQRSGSDKATRFSNNSDSFQSSIGFYLTGEIYRGQHGKSLRLDGMDEGFNSNARKRSIVVHGADYVSQGTINALGRLGRSQGCPAVAPELANEVIDTIEGRTVLFINVNDLSYTSRYLDEHLAAAFAINSLNETDTVSTLDTIVRI